MFTTNSANNPASDRHAASDSIDGGSTARGQAGLPFNVGAVNGMKSSGPAPVIDGTRVRSSPPKATDQGIATKDGDSLPLDPRYGLSAYAQNQSAGQWQDTGLRYHPGTEQGAPPPSGPGAGFYGYSQSPPQYDPSTGTYYRDQRFFMAGPGQGHAFPPSYTSYGGVQDGASRQMGYPIPGGHISYGTSPTAYMIPQPGLSGHSPSTDGQYAYGGPGGNRQPPPRRAPGYPISQQTYTQGPENSRRGSIDPTPSYPRGPPRKPKQSGFAVWVGNLNPGTTIVHMKEFFSRGATEDIESVFLMSKSNCAFVNYRTNESAQAAVARFHDARLNGVRLVCRLRHGQNPTSPTTTMTTLLADRRPSVNGHVDGQTDGDEGLSASLTDGMLSLKVQDDISLRHQERVPERFFVVKSLTLQDLEASLRDGIWATQSHNEAVLNSAFESADAVYLIFSANKSGEYFGFARMCSPITEENVTRNPRVEPASPTLSDGPTATPTPATANAPSGRIIDDSARGTIFWEAESASNEPRVDGEAGDSSPEKVDGELYGESKQDWGKPFRVKWLSTNKLPFYKTRGLRNPWNANREVKIARDGTELEPSVGRRLMQMFYESGIERGRPDGGMYHIS